MSDGIRSTASCPGDDALLSWLDGAQADEQQAAVQDHLRDCPRCQGRVEELERRRAAVSAWLERHDPDPPPRSEFALAMRRRARWARSTWGALAASIVVAVGVAAGPARGWFLDRLGWSVERPTDPTVQGGAAGTAFLPRGAEVTVTFDPGVAGRTLVVGRAADSMVKLDAPVPGGEVLARPDGIEVRGGEEGAVYRLFLPPSVARVRVRVEGSDEILVQAAPGGAETTVEIPG